MTLRTTLIVIAAYIVLMLTVLASNAAAHGGRTDEVGGHADSKTGLYHCHSEECIDRYTPAEVKYRRSAFPHWADDDGDCVNTRHQFLTDQSNSIVAQWRCKVVAGHWVGEYSGVSSTNPKSFDIDHVVPLKEAWVSGASFWTRELRKQFANDPDNLAVSYYKVNRAKGSKDIANWTPNHNLCDYVRRWVFIKSKYGLLVDGEEARAIASLQEECRQ